MTVVIANTANTHTFDYWRNRTNELAYAMTAYAVTAGGSNTAAGNAAISGSFTSNALIVNTSINVGNSTVNSTINSSSISVGNTTINSDSLSVGTGFYIGNSTSNTVVSSTNLKLSNTTSNIMLTIPSSSQVSSGDYFFSSSGSWVAINVSSTIASITLSGLSTQIVNSFQKASFLAAEYIVYVKDNNANNRVASKLLVMHDGGTTTSNAFLSEYSVIVSNNTLGTWSTTTNTTHTILQYSPTSSNVTINYTRLVV